MNINERRSSSPGKECTYFAVGQVQNEKTGILVKQAINQVNLSSLRKFYEMYLSILDLNEMDSLFGLFGCDNKLVKIHRKYRASNEYRT